MHVQYRKAFQRVQRHMKNGSKQKNNHTISIVFGESLIKMLWNFLGIK